MPQNLVRQPFWGQEFLKFGLNTTDNAIMVPFQNMTVAKNILVGSTWARRKRPGIAYWNTDGKDELSTYPTNPLNNSGSDGDPIVGIFEFTRDEGGTITSDLMVRQSDKIYAIDSRTSTPTDIDPDTSPTDDLPSNTDNKICWQPFYDKLYWASDSGSEFRVWGGTGTDYDTPAEPYSGTPKYLALYKERLVAAGFTGQGNYPYTVHLSKVGVNKTTGAINTLDWTVSSSPSAGDATSFLVDSTGDPEGVTGLCVFQDRLYIFLRRAIFVLTGNDVDDFILKPVVIGIGAINNNCILPIGNDVYFLSERGLLSLRSTDKAIESEYGYMSRDIAETYHNQLDKSLASQWDMVYDENENLLYITCASTGSTENDQILVYNTEKNVWTIWDGIDARSFAQVALSGGARIVAGREDGVIALLGESTRQDLESVDYAAQFLTGIYYPGDAADIEHVFEEVTVLCSAKSTSSITLQVSIDSEIVQTETLTLNTSGALLGSTFVLGTSTLSKGTFTPKNVKVKGRGFGIQIRVSYPGDEDVEVYGFIIGSRPAGKRREI